MTSGSPNTSDFDSSSNPWLVRQELFVASLQHQPLLLVVRPEPDDLLAGREDFPGRVRDEGGRELGHRRRHPLRRRRRAGRREGHVEQDAPTVIK